MGNLSKEKQQMQQNASAAEKYGEGKSWYLHYKAADYEGNLFDITTSTIREAKLGILQKFQQNRRETLTAGKNLSFEERQFFSDFVLGKWNNLMEENITPGFYAGTLPDLDISKLDEIIKGDSEKITKGKFLAALNQVIEQLDNNYKDLADGYKDLELLKAASINKNTTTNATRKANNLSALTDETNTDLEKIILQDVLGRQQLKIFQPKSDGSTSYNKIRALHDAVAQIPADQLSGYYIQHGDSDEITTTNTKSATLLEAAKKVKKYINQITAIGLESALAEGMKNAKKQGIKGLQSIKPRGSKSIDCTLKLDPELERQMQMLITDTDAVANMQKAVSKADIWFTFSDSQVTVGAGITVKKNEALQLNADQSVNITLQSGTPLYTLLVREAGLKAEDMLKIQHLAISRGGKGVNTDKQISDAQLVEGFSKVMELAKWLAFVDTLMGKGVNDYNYCMAVNNNIYYLGDIILNIVKGNGNANLTEAIGKKGAQGGLNRRGYIPTEWVHQTGKYHNWSDAFIRSNQAQQYVVSKLYNTKIQMTITGFQLAQLTPKGSIKI